jgi:hypothetical protein
VWINAAQIAGSLASFGGFVFLGWQIRRERKARAFETYERISSRFSDVLWRAAPDPTLDDIWEQPDARTDELVKLGSRAWDQMLPDERRAFRYTRSAFDVLEQAWEAKQEDLIDDEVWEKWQAWLYAWRQTRYSELVVRDDDPLSPFQKDFVRAVREAPAAR